MVECGWAYMLNGKKIWVQKLLGEYHYYDVDGWHPLSEMIRVQLKQCKNSGLVQH